MISTIPIQLPAHRRGMHLITSDVLTALPALPANGLLHLFIQHTSAGLTINENYDPTVRTDFARMMDHLVPENLPFLEHTLEGPDDMPAHVKSSLVGSSVSIPIQGRKLALGTWQGIYLCEFRNHGGSRRLIATVWGD